mgnify:CR=1 FL=1
MSEHKNTVTFLSAKKNSCVIRCSCCNSYQVSFKNLIVNFKYGQFESFRDIFLKDKLVFSEESTYNNKTTMIKVASDTDLFLAFDEDEISEMKELLFEVLNYESQYSSININ